MATAAIPPGFGFAHLPQRPLPPLESGMWALTSTEVRRWFERAAIGDELVYARGPRLVQSDGVKLLQQLHDRGLVTFTSRRIGPDDTAFLVQRLKGDERPPARAQLAVRSRSGDTEDELAMLMAILRRTAGKRAPCPSNRELGEEMGNPNPDRVAYLLSILARERRIEVEARPRGHRVVTILATGKRTALFPALKAVQS